MGHSGLVVVMVRFSSILQLKRTLAWVLRFIQQLKQKVTETVPLTAQKIHKAEVLLMKNVQQDAFADGLTCVKENRRLSRESPLRDIHLFLDNEGLLRVTGRFQCSGKPFSERHPVVLPKDHHYCRLLMHQTQRRLLHAGVRDTLVQLREQYWIVQGRQLVKN